MCRSTLFLLIVLFTNNSLINALSNQLYVVPFPSLIDTNSDGSLAHPYLPIQQAFDYIERDYYRDTTTTTKGKTTISLYPTHHFVGTLRFTQAHSHTRLTTMSADIVKVYQQLTEREQTHKRLSTASISGDVPITRWIQTSGNTYSAILYSSYHLLINYSSTIKELFVHVFQ